MEARSIIVGNLRKMEVYEFRSFLLAPADITEHQEVRLGVNFERMHNLTESAKALRELLNQRILVLDGAMGTMLQQRELTAEDFGGAALEGCNENLVRTRPDVVLDIHRKYFEAGSDIVETNSFRGDPIVLAEHRLAHDALTL